MWFHNYISSDFFHSQKKHLVGIKDTTCSVVAFKSDKRIYFVCLSLANLFLQWDSLLRFVQFKDLWWPSTQRKFKSFNLFASFRWNLNKVSMKVSSQKKELIPYINFGRNNQLSDYRWLYMIVCVFGVSRFKCHGRINVYILHDPCVLRCTPARNQLLINWFRI